MLIFAISRKREEEVIKVPGGVPVSVSSALSISDDGFAIRELRIAVSPAEMQTLVGMNESLYNEQTASCIYRFNPHVSVKHVQEFLRMLQYFIPLEDTQTVDESQRE